jgi:hypothetical protein
MTKRKPTETEALEQAESDAAADAAVDRQALLDNDEDEGPTANEYSVAFSPRNVAVGLAIVAGLVAFAASRHRRKRDAGREDH